MRNRQAIRRLSPSAALARAILIVCQTVIIAVAIYATCTVWMRVNGLEWNL